MARVPRRRARHVLVTGLVGVCVDPMVSPQPRLQIGRSARLRWAVGLTVALAALAAVLVLALGQGPRLKDMVDQLRGYPAWLRRAALGPEDPAFNGLAASQVGYGPSMLKQFSSP